MSVCIWLYGNWVVDLAVSRGWIQAQEHGLALADAAEHPSPKNEDRVALSHPFNYLTEDEVERWERIRP